VKSLTSTLLELANDILDIDPTVDIHFKVELFRCVAKNEGEHSSETITLSSTHYEASFCVACRAKMVVSIEAVVGAFAYHTGRRIVTLS